MSLGLIGKKIGMTRLFDQEAGSAVAVTVIDVGGNELVQQKTEDSKDGYSAVQVAYSDQKEQRMKQPVMGHLKKHGVAAKRIIREFRLEEGEKLPESHPGAELFKDGQSNSTNLHTVGTDIKLDRCAPTAIFCIRFKTSDWKLMAAFCFTAE